MGLEASCLVPEILEDKDTCSWDVEGSLYA